MHLVGFTIQATHIYCNNSIPHPALTENTWREILKRLYVQCEGREVRPKLRLQRRLQRNLFCNVAFTRFPYLTKKKQYLEHLPHRENSVLVKLLNVTQIKAIVFVSLLRSKQKTSVCVSKASHFQAQHTISGKDITASKWTFGTCKRVYILNCAIPLCVVTNR